LEGGKLNSFDLGIIKYLNQFSQHSWVFDKSIGLIASLNLFKGCPLVIVIWWAWFKGKDRHSLRCEHAISTLFGCVVAIAVARGLALMLPFRLRPMHDESLHFVVPFGVDRVSLDGWSSFPSDHAVLFFALSTGLFFISKKIGVLAFFHSVLVIAFPRAYLGLHYPTDLIAGAIVGIAIALTANLYFAKNKHIQSIVSFSYSKPSVFYPLLFFFTYQLVDMFYECRVLATLVSKAIRGLPFD
jgi:undecaprenyl-diphosphatase